MVLRGLTLYRQSVILLTVGKTARTNLHLPKLKYTDVYSCWNTSIKRTKRRLSLKVSSLKFDFNHIQFATLYSRTSIKNEKERLISLF